MGTPRSWRVDTIVGAERVSLDVNDFESGGSDLEGRLTSLMVALLGFPETCHCCY